MEILTLPLGQLETNSYLILPDNSDSAVLVDAPFGAASAIPSILEKHGRKLAAILLTHGHWDHIWDTAALAESTGAKIYAGEEGRQLVENPKFQLQYFSIGDFAGAKIDVFPKDGMELEIAGMKIKCFEAPGHCPGSIIYFVKDSGGRGVLFAGDVIFADSIGRTDLWGGSYAALEKSIKEKIFTLPASTVIYPGHGEPTTVAHERQYNPYFGG